MNLLVISSFPFAQQGSKALQIAGEAIIPVSQEPSSFELSLKGLYGIIQNGQLIFIRRFLNNKLKNMDGTK